MGTSSFTLVKHGDWSGLSHAEEEEEHRLMELRQAYKKAKMCLTRTESHLDYSKHSLAHEKTPHGLAIQVQCHAYRKEATSIVEQFRVMIRVSTGKPVTDPGPPLQMVEGPANS